MSTKLFIISRSHQIATVHCGNGDWSAWSVSKDKTLLHCFKRPLTKALTTKPTHHQRTLFFVKQGQEQADHKQGEYRQCTRQLTTNIGDNPLVAPHLGTNTLGLPWHKMGLPPQEILKEIAHLLCGPYPSSPRCPVLPQIAQEAACHTLAPLSTARSTRVIVRLYATRLSTASIASLMDEFRQILDGSAAWWIIAGKQCQGFS